MCPRLERGPRDVTACPHYPWMGMPNGERPRVLVVDDDSGMRIALRTLLKEEGIEVVGEARDAHAGLRDATELDPDVVLMDMRMPGMDGITATRRLKRIAPTVQVIILSAYDEEALSQGATEAGAYSYLIKGSDPNVVSEAIFGAWRLKSSLDALSPPGRRDRG